MEEQEADKVVRAEKTSILVASAMRLQVRFIVRHMRDTWGLYLKMKISTKEGIKSLLI
jgi:hypothetical protein